VVSAIHLLAILRCRYPEFTAMLTAPRPQEEKGSVFRRATNMRVLSPSRPELHLLRRGLFQTSYILFSAAYGGAPSRSKFIHGSCMPLTQSWCAE
jgi:hypothetical protein